ncbi:MAG: class I SAM-dependent methyltransferase [Pseudorhodobacter sp.]
MTAEEPPHSTDPQGGTTRDVTQTGPFASPPHNLRDTDPHIPLTSQAVFWRPRHPVTSPLLGQIPFLFWLVETLRPQSIAQIGLGDGAAYLAICQAVERLDLRATCQGFCTSIPLLPATLQAAHDSHYADFSELITADPTTALPHLDDRIDMLLIHDQLPASQIERVIKDWLPRLTDQAVIVICDADHGPRDPAQRQAIRAEAPNIVTAGSSTPGGQRMEVILYGRNQPERLHLLTDRETGRAALLAARMVFNRLGQGLEQAARVRALEEEQVRLHHIRTEAETRLAAQRDEVAELRIALETTETTGRTEAAKQADLCRKLEGHLQAKTAHADDLREHSEQLETELEEAQVVLAASLARQQSNTPRLATLEAENNQLRQQEAKIRQDRTQDQGRIQVLEQEKGQLAHRLKKLEQHIEALHAQRKKLEQHVEALHAQREEILNSRSWRITRPLRRFKVGGSSKPGLSGK